MTSFAADEGAFASGIGETGGVAELDAGSDTLAVSAGGSPLEGAGGIPFNSLLCCGGASSSALGC